MTGRIVCKNCEAESFSDGASLACWKCYTALQAEVERLRAIETNVKGIIPLLNRHLQEIRETASGDPGVKYAIEIGYLDCLGTLKDALFEANLPDDDPRHIKIDGLRLVLPTREQPKKKRARKEKRE